jgi:hypothetical protein
MMCLARRARLVILPPRMGPRVPPGLLGLMRPVPPPDRVPTARLPWCWTEPASLG